MARCHANPYSATQRSSLFGADVHTNDDPGNAAAREVSETNTVSYPTHATARVDEHDVVETEKQQLV